MTKKTIYLAAPLFNKAERDFNSSLMNLLEPCANVYLPQIDGDLFVDLVAQGEGPDLASKKIFDNDIKAIKDCDVLLAVLNGQSVDEGVSFELGVAWCLNKVCVGFKDDARQLMPIGGNPMIERSLSSLFDNENDLLNWAKSLGEL